MGPDQDQARPLLHDVWTARYEDLRRQVLEEHRGLGEGAGLSLLVRRGLTAWMQAWPEEVAPWPPWIESDGPGERGLIEPICLPAGLRHQMAQVLASIVLNRQ